MDWLRDFLGSSLGGQILNVILGGLYNRQFQEFEEEQVEPINEAAQQYLSSLGQPGNVNQLARNLATEGRETAALRLNPLAVEQRIQQALGGVVPGVEEVAGRARTLVGEMSEQQKADVQTQFERDKAAALGGLAERGVVGSTIAPSVVGSLTEARNAEMGRVEDQRLANLLGVEGTFGLAVPQAEMAVGQTGLATGENAILNQLAMLQQFGLLPIQTGLQTAQTGLGYFGQPTLIAPAPFPQIQVQPQFKP